MVQNVYTVNFLGKNYQFVKSKVVCNVYDPPFTDEIARCHRELIHRMITGLLLPVRWRLEIVMADMIAEIA